MRRNQIVAEARSWLGTPYHHQAALKGIGCDCIGLLRGIFAAFGGTVDLPADYSPSWHVHRAEERLRDGLRRYGQEVPLLSARPGDILLFGIGKGPAAHGAVLVEDSVIIHAYAEAGVVIASRLTGRWLAWRRAAFVFPGVED
jgi:NlpC/P60 family putative phage cell wall peptidase